MKYFILSCAAILAISCSSEYKEPAAGDITIDIQPDQLPDLKERAESGSIAAANTLAVYYGSIGNDKESEKWLYFAGVRGDCNALTVIWSDNNFSANPDSKKAENIEKIADKLSCNLKSKSN